MEAYPVVRLLSTGVLLFALTCSVHGQIRSLYGDVRAYRVGDVITVILLESAQAQRESRWANASEASSEGGAVLQGGVLPGSPSIGLNTSAKNAASNQNQSVQRDLLRATLSARVVGTDEGGNLLIEGQRTVEINGERHLMRIRGVVRPFDVRADNTVLSTQIADAQITYRRDGLLHRFARPGFWTRLLAAALSGVVLYAAVGKLLKSATPKTSTTQ